MSTLIFAAFFLFAVGSASALTETEPNNEILAANGPISAGETVSGSLFTGSEEDWYWLQLKGQQQITLSATVQNNHSWECLDGTKFDLLKADGKGVLELNAAFPDQNYEYDLEEEVRSSIPAVGEVRYTTPPEEGTYFITVSQEYQGTCSYTFNLSPSSSYGGTPAKSPIVEVPEPNDLKREAYGPLKGGIAYSGRIDTINDVEWLAFSARGGRRLSIWLTTGGCGGSTHAEIFNWWNTNETYAPVDLDADANTRGETTLQALPSKERYFVEIKGSVGCPWQLELSPKSAVFIRGKKRHHHHRRHRHHRHHHH